MDREQSQHPSHDPHEHSGEEMPPMAAKLIAPAVSMGLTWAARKAMNAAYEKKTGQQPPIATDQTVPLRKVLMWAAVTAVVTTAIDTIVNRVVSERLPEETNEASSPTAPAIATSNVAESAKKAEAK